MSLLHVFISSFTIDTCYLVIKDKDKQSRSASLNKKH